MKPKFQMWTFFLLLMWLRRSIGNTCVCECVYHGQLEIHGRAVEQEQDCTSEICSLVCPPKLPMQFRREYLNLVPSIWGTFTNNETMLWLRMRGSEVIVNGTVESPFRARIPGIYTGSLLYPKTTTPCDLLLLSDRVILYPHDLSPRVVLLLEESSPYKDGLVIAIMLVIAVNYLGHVLEE